MLTILFYLHESLGLFYSSAWLQFGVHLERVLSLFQLSDFVLFLSAGSGSKAYGSVTDVKAVLQL